MEEREAALGATTSGVWTTAAARAAGLTDDQVRRRLELRLWQRLRTGTYTYGGVTPDPLMRASAVVQACTTPRRRAVAAGRTAARVWSLPLVDDDDPATQRFEHTWDDVAVSFGEATGRNITSRQLRLQAADICFVGGVAVLSLPRTLVDLAGLLRPDALVCVLDAALHREDITPEALASLVDAHAWQPGAPSLRRAVRLADGRAESPHETLTRLLLLPVLPGLRPQVRVLDRSGQVIARLDLGDERLRLAVESDGATFHAGRAAQDRRRDRRTGWTVERCTWFETRREGPALVRRVLATAAELEARRAS